MTLPSAYGAGPGYQLHTPIGADTPSATIYSGGVLVSPTPLVIHTVVGSCIAVCLHDPVTGVGGMNHYMLPSPMAMSDDASSARFGVNAMADLIAAMQRLGAHPARLVAKVFGGACGVPLQGAGRSVPTRNIAFIHDFASGAGLRVAAWDVGGTSARVLRFQTWSGRAFVKRFARAPKAPPSEEQS